MKNDIIKYIDKVVADVYRYIDKIIENVHEKIDRRFTDYDKAVQTAIASTDKATLKTAEETKDNKKQQNEWRGTLNDIVGKMMTRTEFNSIIMTAVAVFGLLIAGVGLIVTIIAAIITVLTLIK